MGRWAIPEQFHHLIVDGRFKLDSTVLANLSASSTSAAGGGGGGGAPLPERPPAAGSYPPQWTSQGPRPMDDGWKPLWDQTVISLADALEAIAARRVPDPAARTGCDGDNNNDNGGGGGGGGGGSVLGYLFGRLGRDCGRFLRELHAMRISWGTYQDQMCRRDFDEWHCNAHANNMVLLPEAEVGDTVGGMAWILILTLLSGPPCCRVAAGL